MKNSLIKVTSYPFFIALTVALVWCWVYGIKSWHDLQVPYAYGGDGAAVYALIKAYATGEIYPIFFKFVDTLNAPFFANWNDYPSEDWIYFPPGILVALFGLSMGVWLYLLTIQVLAGLSFYTATRLFSLDKNISAVCAILFSLSSFAFYRNIGHLTVNTYWHIPLLLVTLIWCTDATKVQLSKRNGLWFGTFSGLIAGIYNPYYWFIFLFLLGIILVSVVYQRNWKQSLGIMLIFGAAVFGFILSNVDTLLFAFMHGKGSVFARSLSDLFIYGLNLSDIAIPPQSRFAIIDEISNHYNANYPFKSEARTAYIGIIALVGLIWLIASGTIKFVAKAYSYINEFFWIALGVFAFAITGGINLLLGSLGFTLLRATNRYSILLMAIGLLVMARLVGSIKIKYAPVLLASIALPIGLYDQLPMPVPQTVKDGTYHQMKEDQTVANILEKELSKGAMVFQLPVKAFPETGPIQNMDDYDHFRPWLWTSYIHFSYGTMKGRGDADWQNLVAIKPVDKMLHDLDQFGFSALLIYRPAYDDQGNELAASIMMLGYERIIDLPDYLGFKLKPVKNPELPLVEYYVEYGKGFYGFEADDEDYWQWTDGDALMVIKPSWYGSELPSENQSGSVLKVRFNLSTNAERSVWMEIGKEKTLVYQPDRLNNLVTLTIKPEDLPLTVRLFSDVPGVLPGNGDPRKLAFQVRNLKIEEIGK